MEKPPPSVAILGWVFILAGIIMVAASVVSVVGSDASLNSVLATEEGLILAVRTLAIVGGAFLLRGENWARWLLVLWIAYHVVLSLYHPLFELVVHSLLLIAVVYVLFRQEASSFFNGKRVESP